MQTVRISILYIQVEFEPMEHVSFSCEHGRLPKSVLIDEQTEIVLRGFMAFSAEMRKNALSFLSVLQQKRATNIVSLESDPEMTAERG